MPNTINAITTGIGGLTTTADNSGAISLQSAGSTVVAVTSGGVAVTGTMTVGGNAVLNAGTAVTVAQGGTGQTTYTDGQLLIGNTTGNTLTKATLTGTSNQITVTNGNGSITLSTPQSINTSASVQFGSFGVGTAASGTTGEIRATNNVTAFFSDARLKDFKGTIPNALAKVQALNGYYFTENEKAKELGYNNDKVQVGVSAQEVEAVLPEIVTEAPISAEYKTVYYDKLVPLLIEAIKELKAEVDELKKGK